MQIEVQNFLIWAVNKVYQYFEDDESKKHIKFT